MSLVSYRSLIADNARWEGFAFREGDIVISTPAKCGTTWTQAICALLVFQTPDFPDHLDQISPWLDQSLRKLEDVACDLEAQTHRRFIKSHTPLDGLPLEEGVTYITVGRDPRDVAMSWDNHMSNLDIEETLRQREAAVGNDDLADFFPNGPPPPPPTDEAERFWQWVLDEDNPVSTVAGLHAMLHHLDTFWQQRERPNIVLLHYDDLKHDLEGQMRALAERLGIEVPEERWPELAGAATFEHMRGRAKEVAPNAPMALWRDTTRFFNRGTSVQWRHLLDAEGLGRYAERVASLVDQDLSTWIHRGPIA
jgi:aryl sulfotransferase